MFSQIFDKGFEELKIGEDRMASEGNKFQSLQVPETKERSNWKILYLSSLAVKWCDLFELLVCLQGSYEKCNSGSKFLQTMKISIEVIGLQMHPCILRTIVCQKNLDC